MTTFDERTETQLVKAALTICLELNLSKSIKSKKVKDRIGDLIDVLIKLYDYQKEDYDNAAKYVLSTLKKEDMGKA